MSTSTWNVFEIRIPVNAGMSELYDAWTTQNGIEKWFLRSASFSSADGVHRKRNEHVEGGDHYKWLWHGFPDDVHESRKVTAANGKIFFSI